MGSFLQNRCPILVVTFSLISNLVTEKRRVGCVLDEAAPRRPRHAQVGKALHRLKMIVVISQFYQHIIIINIIIIIR